MLLPGILCLPTCILPGLSVFLVFDSFSLISKTFLDWHYQMFSQNQWSIFYVERLEFHSTVCSMMFVRIKICPVVPRPSLNTAKCSALGRLSTFSNARFYPKYLLLFARSLYHQKVKIHWQFKRKSSSKVHFISNEGSILYQRRNNNS